MSKKYGNFKHNKSGDIYELLMITNVNATRDDFILTAVYRDVVTDELWSRPFKEFNEKFSSIGHETSLQNLNVTGNK